MSDEENLESLAKKKLQKDLANDDVEELKKKVADYEVVIELSAQKEFERELDNILTKIPEHKRSEVKEYIGDDPDRLEATKAALLLNFNHNEPEPSSKKRVSGKASLPIQTKTEYINDIFHIATSTTSPKAQREYAKGKIDELWQHFQQNPEAKEALKKSLKNQETFVMNCPECGSLMYGRKCPTCGYYANEKGGLQ